MIMIAARLALTNSLTPHPRSLRPNHTLTDMQNTVVMVLVELMCVPGRRDTHVTLQHTPRTSLQRLRALDQHHTHHRRRHHHHHHTNNSNSSSSSTTTPASMRGCGRAAAAAHSTTLLRHPHALCWGGALAARQRRQRLRHTAAAAAAASSVPAHPAPGSSSSSLLAAAISWQPPGAGSVAELLPSLSPQLSFAADVALHGVLLPILLGRLLVSALASVTRRARRWCERYPDEPLAMELLGLLPAALEGPATLAVALVVTTRVLRNLVAGVHAFLAAFRPQLANDAAAQLAAGLIGVLGPLDSALLKLYTVLAVLAGARVLVRYKSIALEFILRQRLSTSSSAAAGLRRGGAASSGSGGAGAGGGTGGSFLLHRSSGGSAHAGSTAGAGAAGAAALALRADDGDDDLDEAAVVCREGSMLSVSMRPRSSAAASEPAAALAAKLDGSSTDSGGRKQQQQLQQQLVAADAGGGDGTVERLLLPLDTILSWAISVSAVLFVLQTLGINIAPLLAVGGASSLLIGLATQALLTNAVMGLSIFVSRPFLPGDSITVQAPGGILVSGMVERVTPMRTMLRTDDDVLVTLPNKSIADMIIFNRSRREARNRLVSRSWEAPYLKFKVKLPQKELQHLQELQTDLRAVLRRPGVAQDGISVALSKFTDAGAEVLLQAALLVPAGSALQQQLLLDLAMAVRRHGGTLVSIL